VNGVGGGVGMIEGAIQVVEPRREVADAGSRSAGLRPFIWETA
jgi:hypothetical protein